MLSYCKRQNYDFTTYEELTILSVEYCCEIINLYNIVRKLDALQDIFLCVSSFGNIGINMKIYMRAHNTVSSVSYYILNIELNDVCHHHQEGFKSTAAYENATHII
jgi:hypothetical protein